MDMDKAAKEGKGTAGYLALKAKADLEKKEFRSLNKVVSCSFCASNDVKVKMRMLTDEDGTLLICSACEKKAFLTVLGDAAKKVAKDKKKAGKKKAGKDEGTEPIGKE